MTSFFKKSNLNMTNLPASCPPKCSFWLGEQLFSLRNLLNLPISRLIIYFLTKKNFRFACIFARQWHFLKKTLHGAQFDAEFNFNLVMVHSLASRSLQTELRYGLFEFFGKTLKSHFSQRRLSKMKNPLAGIKYLT